MTGMRYSKRFILLAVFLLLTLTFLSCNTNHNVNCRPLFEKYYDANVEAFMKTMPAKDSVEARCMAEYALNKLYDIDSTFVLMRGKQLEDLIKQNKHLLIERDSTD